MTAPSAVMLFAAGFGTRMRALTKDRPKPLVEVAGRPLIGHTLDLARAVSPSRIAANTHYKPEMLEDWLRGEGIAISREEPEILDTGGGLRKALPLLGGGPVWTSNTDAIWTGGNPFETALSAWNPDEMDALLVCVPLARAVGRQGGGDFTADQSGRISRGGDLVYGGVQILNPEGLQDIEEKSFSLNVLWNRMAGQGRLFAVEHPGRWCDVGRPEGIALAETLLERR
jgi:MurNAc alpha-1-phosphate uridylyltransferase